MLSPDVVLGSASRSEQPSGRSYKWWLRRQRASIREQLSIGSTDDDRLTCCYLLVHPTGGISWLRIWYDWYMIALEIQVFAQSLQEWQEAKDRSLHKMQHCLASQWVPGSLPYVSKMPWLSWQSASKVGRLVSVFSQSLGEIYCLAWCITVLTFPRCWWHQKGNQIAHPALRTRINGQHLGAFGNVMTQVKFYFR